METITPTKHYSSTSHQLCKLIPAHLTVNLAQKHGVDKKTRTFTPWSHVVSLLFAQLTHAIGLNDACDSLRHHGAKIGAISGAVPPSLNTLSHANKHRNSDMVEELFWTVLEHLQLNPKFGPSGRYSGLPRRFKRAIHAVDSTTIALVANCMDWAKHLRRKAAAEPANFPSGFCHHRGSLSSRRHVGTALVYRTSSGRDRCLRQGLRPLRQPLQTN